MHTPGSDLLLEHTIDGLLERLPQHMPNSPYSDFFSWALTDAHFLRDSWLETIGLPKDIAFVRAVYAPLQDDDIWDQLVLQSIPVTIYRVYQRAIDQLFNGLADHAQRVASHDLRLNILRAYHQAVSTRLKGTYSSPQALLASVRPMASRLSLIEIYRENATFRDILANYLRRNPGSGSLDDLARSLWVYLIAAMEACFDVHTRAELTRAHNGLPFFARRLERLESILDDRPTTMDTHLLVHGEALLDAATVRYLIGELLEVLYGGDTAFPVALNETLATTLRVVSVRMRLLQDIGNELLIQSPDERRAMIQDLRQNSGNVAQFAELLQVASEEYRYALQPVAAALQNGSFNVLLHHLSDQRTVGNALSTLDERLAYFARMHTTTVKRLQGLLDQIAQQMNDDLLCQVIVHSLAYFESDDTVAHSS